MSNPEKAAPETEGTTTTVSMDVSSNAAPPVPLVKTDPNIKYKDDGVESEDIDEEEALLVTLEKEKEKEEAEEAAHPHEQPKSVNAAPCLLQAALQKGLVAASDSEEEETKKEEEKKIAAASPEKAAAMKNDSAKMEEEKKGDDQPAGEPHYHARVSSQMAFYYAAYITVSHNDLQTLVTG